MGVRCCGVTASGDGACDRRQRLISDLGSPVGIGAGLGFNNASGLGPLRRVAETRDAIETRHGRWRHRGSVPAHPGRNHAIVTAQLASDGAHGTSEG